LLDDHVAISMLDGEHSVGNDVQLVVIEVLEKAGERTQTTDFFKRQLQSKVLLHYSHMLFLHIWVI